MITDRHGFFSKAESTFGEDKRLRGDVEGISKDSVFDLRRISRNPEVDQREAEQERSVEIRFESRAMS